VIFADETVAYYLERMRQGDYEEAFFGLIEAWPDVVPALIDAFAKEKDRGVRAQIVQYIWQHRRPETVSFLAHVLHDPEPAVWKEALDGLVAIGGDGALKALEAARAQIPASRAGRAITREWVDEALEQVRERYACPNDGMMIPMMVDVQVEAELVQFFWCWWCAELFASVGNPRRAAGRFKRAGSGWQLVQSEGAERDVRLAVAAVSHVGPQRDPPPGLLHPRNSRL
jgi:hypothetical protein